MQTAVYDVLIFIRQRTMHNGVKVSSHVLNMIYKKDLKCAINRQI